MTLNETIEREKYMAVLNCDTATTYHTDDNIIYNEKAEIYREKAEYHAQIAEWLKELKQLKLREQTRWISVSERLPNNTFPVLVSVNVRGIMNIITTRTAWFNSVKKVWIVHHKDNEVIGEVIAWQPLPEPYKAESDKEGDKNDT